MLCREQRKTQGLSVNVRRPRAVRTACQRLLWPAAGFRSHAAAVGVAPATADPGRRRGVRSAPAGGPTCGRRDFADRRLPAPGDPHPPPSQFTQYPSYGAPPIPPPNPTPSLRRRHKNAGGARAQTPSSAPVTASPGHPNGLVAVTVVNRFLTPRLFRPKTRRQESCVYYTSRRLYFVLFLNHAQTNSITPSVTFTSTALKTIRCGYP